MFAVLWIKPCDVSFSVVFFDLLFWLFVSVGLYSNL